MKTKQIQYIVYRHGSNRANQSMTPVMPVGIWAAATREQAISAAAAEVVVFNNQYLSAKPLSRASHADQVAASEADYALEIQAKELDGGSK